MLILLSAAAAQPGSEPLGPASRSTGLVISEIMYHPIEQAGGAELEFIEIYNSNPWPENVGGYAVSGDRFLNYFPSNTTVLGNNFLLLSSDPAQLRQAYPIPSWVNIYPITSLPNSEGIIRLKNANGSVLAQVDYGSELPWPVLADGKGYSLVLARPSLGQNNPSAWTTSANPGGSPGSFEPSTNNPLKAVVINEVLANAAEPYLDFIELYNRGDQDLDISGCGLSDTTKSTKYLFQATIIPAHGYLALDEFVLGFSMKAEGETVYFRGLDGTVLDAVRFGAQDFNVSFGRVPEGAEEWRALFPATPFAPNTTLYQSDIVIDEIMYAPISGDPDDEYVELFNRSTNTVDLSGWQFIGGILFGFPGQPGSSFTLIPPGGYVVAAHNREQILEHYPYLSPEQVFGPFSGALSNDGERVVLQKPVIVATSTTTNIYFATANEVTYPRGKTRADAGGSSLELIDSQSDNSRISNWMPSDESRKAPWTTIAVTATAELGTGSANELHVLMLQEGECLIDDVELVANAGQNLIPNPSFETGTNNWTIQGNHIRSSIEAEGASGTQSLHVRASGPGDTGVNRIKTHLATSVTAGSQITFRAKARWLGGHPDILLRLGGNWAEAIGHLNVPANLGTPGLPNSRAVANSDPIISTVQHDPVLPTNGQSILITARISDPDGLAGANVFYRADGNTSYSSVRMVDDGTGGDAISGDGIYNARIAGFPAGTLVTFYIEARDQGRATGPVGVSRFPSASDCLVRIGEPRGQGLFATTRIWMTSSNLAAWSSRSPFSDEPLPCTIVHGDARIIYNAQIRYWGDSSERPSYANPLTSGTRYFVQLPADEPLLGGQTLMLDGFSTGTDSTLLREFTAFWLSEQMELPHNHLRFTPVVINGVQGTNRNIPIFVDRPLAVNGPLPTWLDGSSSADFFRIQSWAEFSDVANPVPLTQIPATLEDFRMAAGDRSKARYRWNWVKEKNGGLDDDYNGLFGLIDTANAPSTVYASYVATTLDQNEWAGMLALRHIVGDPAGYGYSLGADSFVYHPDGGKWVLLPNQLRRSFGLGDPPQTDPFLSSDPLQQRLLSEPGFRRLYLRAIRRALNGPFNWTQIQSDVLTPRIQALQASGVNISATAISSIQSWINSRRTTLDGAVPPGMPFSVQATSGANNLIVLSGTGPFSLDRITVDGYEAAVRWTSITNWRIDLFVSASKNLQVAAYNDSGNLIATTSLNINYTGAPPLPAGAIVFSEILYDPKVPGGGFVELYNRSSFGFDMSGWQIPELGFGFAAGTQLGPGDYVVLVENRAAFTMAFGASSPITAELPTVGNLSGVAGLSLINGNTNINRIKFEHAAPWPEVAPGESLQLINSAEDNTRPGNWSGGAGWRFYSYTGVVGPTGGRLLLYLNQPGAARVDSVSLVAGSEPESGANLMLNGNFESGLASWSVFGNHSNSTVTSAVAYRGSKCLDLVSSGVGGTLGYVFQDIAGISSSSVYTLSFWYRGATNAGTLNFRLSGSFRSGLTGVPVVRLDSPAPTPGNRSSVAFAPQSFAPLWLNEVKPVGQTNIVDNAGEAEPWIELFNSSTNTVSLSGLYLSTNFSNPTNWAFPANSSIGPREFKIIWMDGEPNETSGTNVHAGLRLQSATGVITLSQVMADGPHVLDYISYHNVPDSWSYGSYPSGQLLDRFFYQALTPRAGNQPPEVRVFINEWMASNTRTLFDPADSDAEDWFELYNASPNPLDLSNFWLSDRLSGSQRVRIPSGTIVPGKGFLLVWADGEPDQNGPGRDLHVGFGLSKGGEAIVLFAPDGETIVDSVSFGPQTNDVSQGRWPDSAQNIMFMQTPTPRAPNVGGTNSPPSVSANDIVLLPGERLNYRLNASDMEAPPQTLTFTLASGPAGASADRFEGVVTWTPAPSQMPSTNIFSVRVADDGVPPLETIASFKVTVMGPPQPIFSKRLPDGSLELKWSTVAGKTYRVQFKNALSDPQWQNQPGDLLSSGQDLMVRVVASGGQMFFRIVQLN